MVGIGTILADDPLLTARLKGVENDGIRQPVRIVVDPALRMPASAQMLAESLRPARVIVLASQVHDQERARALTNAGATVVAIPARSPDDSDVLDMRIALEQLASQGVQRVLVEGGSHTIGALFDQSLIDEVKAFVAPSVVIGGREALSPVGGVGVPAMNAARRVLRSKATVNQSGEVEIRALLTDPMSLGAIQG
jgi:diaminohydroxyphosphoribosylaminopyrimidine deaminase/5-amino-6-(5-phosphoribosylamino)uracil reductase